MIPEDFKYDFKKIHQALSTTYKRQMEIKKDFPHEYNWPSFPSYLYRKGFAEEYKAFKKEWDKEVEAGKDWRKARAEFNDLSHKMTVLCCLLNHAKGKLHMSSYEGEPFDKEMQASWASGFYKEFELLESVPEKQGPVASRLAR